MEVVTVADQERVIRQLLSSIFGALQGYVCISTRKSGKRDSWKDEFFEFPVELPNIIEYVAQKRQGFDVYFSPMVYSGRSRKKEFVASAPVAYSDLDTCDPENLLVEPTWTIESSPGRFQAYWVMEEPLDPLDAEDLSRRIAYKHAEQGADKSGFDLSQALRMPTTYNYKYAADDEIPTVKVLSVNRKVYRLEDFAEDYPEVTGYEYVDEPMPDVSGMDAEDILHKYRLVVNPRIWTLYQEEPQDDWSKPLWNLQMLLFESGFSREEVFVVARESKCNKYQRDGRSQSFLWKEVCRSQARYEANEFLIQNGGISEKPDDPLLSDEEREAVLQSKDCFVERYAEWAKSLGDAAPQYHQAGAFIALSSLLAGRVRLPTSFGTVIPNLWFMILADTTLTRKTTAMDIAMDMVTEIDPDALLATDGSIEGLLTSLATRPSRPSVFLRDEFTGLLEQMTKKDYMAGMPELLTKLYDGKTQKRILRKETVEVKEPVLIMFAGGIKNKITQLLTTEQVSSGFMPRFVFITAESDVSRLKPIGPPTQRTINNGQAIKDELTSIFNHYNKTVTLNITQLKVKEEVQQFFTAELTDDAWVRYNQLEYAMLESGLHSKQPDIMTPTYDRLSKSILKASVLLAAARCEEKVVVGIDDILRAIYYGERWKMYVEEVVSKIGTGQAERQLETIYKAIQKNPGITKSTIMQNYHLSARDASSVFDTLEQRGMVISRRQGRGFQYFAGSSAMKGIDKNE